MSAPGVIRCTECGTEFVPQARGRKPSVCGQSPCIASQRKHSRDGWRKPANWKPLPRKYERHESKIGGLSAGIGRGVRGFWTKVEKTETCWLWRGYLDKNGSGKFTTMVDGKQRTFRAHRFAYALHAGLPAGPIPALCGNQACVRPDHRVPMTAEELGRWHRQGAPADNRGELSPRATLRDEDVLFIRSQESAYGLVPLLARIYGVKPQVISCVRSRRTWRHLGNGSKANSMPLEQLRGLLAQRTEKLDAEDFVERGEAA